MADCPGALHFAQMSDGPMVRVRLPGGVVSASQLRTLAALSAENGNGEIDLTNRANLQIRGLYKISPEDLGHRLDEAGLLADAIWADRLRNIMTDPLTGLEATELFNGHGLTHALDVALQKSEELSDLSPKFSFVVDPGGVSRIGAAPHDIALIAQAHGNAPQGYRFRLSLGNKMTDVVCAPEEGVELALSVARATCAVAAKGIPRPSRITDDGMWDVLLEEVPHHHGVAPQFEPHEKMLPARPVPSIGIVPQRQPGKVACGLGVPVAWLTADMVSTLADLAMRHGDGTVRLSPWQVIYIPNVDAEDVDDLLAAAQPHGFVANPRFVAIQVVACAGAPRCERAKLRTKPDGRAVVAAVEALNGAFVSGGYGETRIIHLSGCVKSCAHGAAGDMLALGREDGTGYDIFENTAAKTVADSQPVLQNVGSSDLTQAIVSRLTAKW